MESNVNRRACPSNPASDADQALVLAAPVAYRLWNGTTVVAQSPNVAGSLQSIPGGCLRPADWASTSVMCGGQGDPIANCDHPNCTHCDTSVSHHHYLWPQQRTHLCVHDIRAHEIRRATWYSHVVVHRPDFLLSPLPPLATWDSALSGNQNGSAFRAYFCTVCSGANDRCAVDFFTLIPRPLLTVMQSVLSTYRECHSRRTMTTLGLPNVWKWPWYWGSEGVIYTSYARHGVVPTTMRSMPCGLDRSCPVLGHMHGWGDADPHLHAARPLRGRGGQGRRLGGGGPEAGGEAEDGQD